MSLFDRSNQRVKSQVTKATQQTQLPLILLGLTAISGWIVAFALFSHSVLESHATQQEQRRQQNLNDGNNDHPIVASPAAIVDKSKNDAMLVRVLDDLWPDDYQNEAFTESLSSCIDKCHAETTFPRQVGLLFPPGSFGSVFVDFIREAIQLHYQHKKGDEDMIVIPTSHLPSNSSTFTHIIRFANLPLILAAGDAMLSVGSGISTPLSIADLEEVTKLIIDWHCHLSYMARLHTIPILTLSMERILDQTNEVEQDIRDFLSTSLDPYEDDGDGTENHLFNQDELVSSLTSLIQLIQRSLRELEQRGMHGVDSSVTKKITVDDVVDRIIDEMLNGVSACATSTQKQQTFKINHLYVPATTSTVATRAYQLMKDLEGPSYDGNPIIPNYDQYDSVQCSDPNHPLSKQIACLDREKTFNAKDLVLRKEKKKQQRP